MHPPGFQIGVLCRTVAKRVYAIGLEGFRLPCNIINASLLFPIMAFQQIKKPGAARVCVLQLLHKDEDERKAGENAGPEAGYRQAAILAR